MNRSPASVVGVLAILAGVCVPGGYAQDYAIDWYTVDGGGHMTSTGSDFELSGTIGQEVAGGVHEAVERRGGDPQGIAGFHLAQAIHLLPLATLLDPCTGTELRYCDAAVDTHQARPGRS